MTKPTVQELTWNIIKALCDTWYIPDIWDENDHLQLELMLSRLIEKSSLAPVHTEMSNANELIEKIMDTLELHWYVDSDWRDEWMSKICRSEIEKHLTPAVPTEDGECSNCWKTMGITEKSYTNCYDCHCKLNNILDNIPPVQVKDEVEKCSHLKVIKYDIGGYWCKICGEPVDIKVVSKSA